MPQIDEFFVKWEDSLSQRIDDAALWSELLGKIHSSFVDRQVSVLVHCAQARRVTFEFGGLFLFLLILCSAVVKISDVVE